MFGAVSFLTASMALTACGSSPEAQESGNFSGETIEFIIPFDAGGGYDSYARQLAPELGEKLDADVVVINKPGAGGLLATNEVRNANPDGNTIVMFNTVGHIGSALAEAEGVQYEPEEFSYIGQISSEPDVLITKSGSEYEDFDSVLDAPAIRFAATGPGSNEYVDPVVLMELFGINGEVVTGFGSSNEAYLAVIAGNVDAHSRSLGSQLPGIEAGDADPLLIIGSEPVEQLDDVATLLEVVPEDKRELAEAHTELIESGRTIAAPPETDPQVLDELRTAFEEVVTDSEYQKAAEESGRPVTFASGEDVEAMVSRLMDAPQEYVSMLKRAYGTE